MARRHIIRLQRVDIADNKVVVRRPIVAVHFRFVGVDVVRKDNLPALMLQSEPHQTNAREEFDGKRATAAVRSRHGEAIAARVEPFQRQFVARADLVVLEETADPSSAPEEPLGLPVFAFVPMSVVMRSFRPSRRISTLRSLEIPGFRDGPMQSGGKKS